MNDNAEAKVSRPSSTYSNRPTAKAHTRLHGRETPGQDIGLFAPHVQLTYPL